jgi:hypothetical protein
MDECSIVQFLHLKGVDATKIHRKLEIMLGPDVILDSDTHTALCDLG